MKLEVELAKIGEDAKIYITKKRELVGVLDEFASLFGELVTALILVN